MKSKKTQTIGKVELSYLVDKPDTRYSDAAEDDLLKLFKGDDPATARRQILASEPSWELYYHLSPYRGAVVDWFSFNPGLTVLEIGAGPGAITEALVKQPVNVTALDISEKRCLINAYRNQAHDNLRVLVGNLSQLEETKFDYAVCVGVLEYAGTFIEDPSPYQRFLEHIKASLKPGGQLILAIENRFGLKYWAGAREDHTGSFFEGINNYPGNKAVKTFGRQELADLFRASGFSKTDFYFPYPDYKNPQLIYSSDYYPGKGAQFPLGKLPTPVPGQTRALLFSEALAMVSIEKNGLFPDFSNSFIVVASL